MIVKRTASKKRNHKTRSNKMTMTRIRAKANNKISIKSNKSANRQQSGF